MPANQIRDLGPMAADLGPMAADLGPMAAGLGPSDGVQCPRSASRIPGIEAKKGPKKDPNSRTNAPRGFPCGEVLEHVSHEQLRKKNNEFCV